MSNTKDEMLERAKAFVMENDSTDMYDDFADFAKQEIQRDRLLIAENLDLALGTASGFAELAYFIRHIITELRGNDQPGEPK